MQVPGATHDRFSFIGHATILCIGGPYAHAARCDSVGTRLAEGALRQDRASHPAQDRRQRDRQPRRHLGAGVITLGIVLGLGVTVAAFVIIVGALMIVYVVF